MGMYTYRRAGARSARSSYYRRSGSSITRRARGNYYAASKNTDSTNVTIQGITTLPIRVTTSNTTSVNGEALGISVWQLLINSDFYANYATMYDELRMNGFRLKIIGNSAGTTVLASGLSSVGTVVALDRNGVRGKPATFRGGEDGAITANPFIELDETERSRSWQQALSYGSAKIKSWSPGNAFQQWISANVSNMIEKAQYVKTQELTPSRVKTTGAGDGAQQQYIQGFPSGFVAGTGATALGNQFTKWTGTSDISFDPVILLGVYNIPNTQAGVATEQVFTFSIEFKVDVTFRGVRRSTFNDVMNPGDEQQAKTMVVSVAENGIQDINVRGYTDVQLNTNVPIPELTNILQTWTVVDIDGDSSQGGATGTGAFTEFQKALVQTTINLDDETHTGKDWLVMLAMPVFPKSGPDQNKAQWWELRCMCISNRASADHKTVETGAGDYYLVKEFPLDTEAIDNDKLTFMTGPGGSWGATASGAIFPIIDQYAENPMEMLANPTLILNSANVPYWTALETQ